MSERLRMTVIGTGYLGATHAVCMAELGLRGARGRRRRGEGRGVCRAGRVPFFEPELPELLVKNLESGGCASRPRCRRPGRSATCTSCAWGTPQKQGEYAADMTYVDSAFTALLPHAKDGSLLVGQVDGAGRDGRAAGRARSPRTTPRRSRRAAGVEPGVPARGVRVKDTLTPDRLVFGVPEGAAGVRAEQLLRAAFAPVIAEGRDGQPTPVVVTDFATAQLVKVAANAFLATKISFINAMAEVCEATGGDVTLLSKALSYDTRIGGRFLHAGLGFGGGCLPKDIRAFMARAEELGVDQALSFLKEVDAINLRRRARMIEIAQEVVGGSFGGMRVAVLGAAFKPNSDDIRDSPALDVAAASRSRAPRSASTTRRRWANAKVKHPELGYRDSAHRRRPRRRRRAATSPSGRVPLDGPRRARLGRHRAPHRRRPQRPGPRALARRRLDLPRPRPALTVPYGDRATVDRVLAAAVWAVVGLSTDRSRAAYDVAAFLQAKGRRIVPVHPRAETVHGEPGYPRLADVPFDVDVVDCFVRSELVGPVVDDAIAIGARAVWMQLGVVDHEAAARAQAAGSRSSWTAAPRSSGASRRPPRHRPAPARSRPRRPHRPRRRRSRSARAGRPGRVRQRRCGQRCASRRLLWCGAARPAPCTRPAPSSTRLIFVLRPPATLDRRPRGEDRGGSGAGDGARVRGGPGARRPWPARRRPARPGRRSSAPAAPGRTAARMRTASSPALRAPATDTGRDRHARGICTIDSRESMPSRCLSGTGTPMTGSGVIDATMPGRWAAPPGAGDDDAQAAPGCRARPLEHVAGGAVGRHDAHLVRHVELRERLRRALHDRPVGVAAHDHTDLRPAHEGHTPSLR
jgi:UDPglucose 6-dehydrogenase